MPLTPSLPLYTAQRTPHHSPALATAAVGSVSNGLRVQLLFPIFE